MNLIRTITALGLAVAAGGNFATAPSLKASESVVIQAPVATGWERVKSFDGLANWHPAVAADEIVGGNNDQAGAVRQLTPKDGGTIKEKLLEFSDSGHRFRYTILEGVLPVNAYTSTLVVTPAGKGVSKVTWSGSFKRKESSDDKTATSAISGVYRSGLDNLKTLVESK